MNEHTLMKAQLKKFKTLLKPNANVRESLMCLQETLEQFVKYLEKNLMDKKIKKVRKDMDKKMDALVAMDKPRDKKLKKCAKEMKKK
jgi:hypothetical protein